MLPIRSRAALCAAALSVAAFAALPVTAGAAAAAPPVVTAEPPTGDAPQPFLGELRVLRDGARRTAELPVLCPTAAATPCEIAATLATAAPVLGLTPGAPLGSASATVAPGRFGVLEFRLPAGAVHLSRRGRLAVDLAVSAAGTADPGVVLHRATSLRLANPGPACPPGARATSRAGA